jgi:hypothetical protein
MLFHNSWSQAHSCKRKYHFQSCLRDCKSLLPLLDVTTCVDLTLWCVGGTLSPHRLGASQAKPAKWTQKPLTTLGRLASRIRGTERRRGWEAAPWALKCSMSHAVGNERLAVVRWHKLTDWGLRYSVYTRQKLKPNSVAWVRKGSIPAERPQLVGEVSANFCGQRVPRLYMLNIWNVKTYACTDKLLNTADSGWQKTDPASRQRVRPTETLQ